MGISKKVALVTGAASGIGEGIAVHLARQGASVVVADVDEVKGQKVASRISKGRGEAFFIRMDVSNPSEVQTAVAMTKTRFGGLDILVNNAGINVGLSSGPVYKVPDEVWDLTIDTNLKGTFLCTKHCVPLMRKRGGGSIVNISSMLGLYAIPGASSYCASKGGIISLTRATAMDCAKFKIRANCICPGAIRTPAFGRAFTNQDELRRLFAIYEKGYPAKRIGEPKDVASLVAYLADQASSFITGSVITIDGGMHAQYGEALLKMRIDGII